MFASAVEPLSRLQTESITAAIAVKFSITNAHPSRSPFPILVSSSPLEFATAATQSCCARLSGCVYSTVIALCLYLVDAGIEAIAIP